MNDIRRFSRVMGIALLVPIVASCATGERVSDGHVPSHPVSVAPRHSTPPVDSPKASAPQGNAVPYTVVATGGPPLYGRVYAATTMNALPTPMAALSCAWPDACYPNAAAPASSLLIAFDPAAVECQRVSGYTASLRGRTLRIKVSGHNDCPSPLNAALQLSPSVLLAIPLAALPSGGQLTITITPFGERYGAPAEETGTADLS